MQSGRAWKELLDLLVSCFSAEEFRLFIAHDLQRLHLRDDLPNPSGSTSKRTYIDQALFLLRRNGYIDDEFFEALAEKREPLAGKILVLSRQIPREHAFLPSLIGAGNLSSDQVLTWSIQLLEQLSSLHEQGKTCRSLRPESFAIDDEGGLSPLEASAESDRYTPPEKQESLDSLIAADRFAAGAIIADLCDAAAEPSAELCQLLGELASALCRDDPAERISASDALSRLRDARNQPDSPLSEHVGLPEITVASLEWALLSLDDVCVGQMQEALDRLALEDHATFAVLIDRVVHAARKPDLVAIAAIDALFSCVGRLLYQRCSWTPRCDLSALCERQLAFLHPERPEQPPVPLTRTPDALARVSWPAECWAWSLYLEEPKVEIAKELTWFFPGWTAPALEQLEEREPPFDDLGYPRFSRQPDDPFEQLLAMVPKVIERCSHGEIAKIANLPPLLLADYLALAPVRGWPFTGAMARSLLERASWQADRLRTAFQHWTTERRRAFASAFWRAALDDDLDLWGQIRWEGRGELIRDTLAYLDDELVLTTFPVTASDYEIKQLFPLLPARVRSRVMRKVLQDGRDQTAYDLCVHPDFCGPEDTNVLLVLIEHTIASPTVMPGTPIWVMQQLWHVAPETAMEHAERSFATGDLTREWFTASSNGHAERLLAIIADAKARGDDIKRYEDWLRYWLVRRLRRRPDLAPRIMPLLQPWLATEP